MMPYLMGIEEILKYLPHRYPFLLVDKVLEIKQDSDAPTISVLKNVTINEAYFAGHFPNQFVMPGVLILEAMAQAAAILAYKLYYDKPTHEAGLCYLVGIDKARFKHVVVPGDQLHITVTIKRHKPDLLKFDGKASVEQTVACFAEFLSIIKNNQAESKETDVYDS